MPNTKGPQNPTSASSLESVQMPVVLNLSSPPPSDANPEWSGAPEWHSPTPSELAARVQVILADDLRVVCGNGSERVVRPRRRRHPQLELVAMVEVGAVDPPKIVHPLVEMSFFPPPRREEVRLPKLSSGWRHPHKGRPSRAMLRSAEE